MSDESVGYYWAQAAKEREAREQHDIDHPGDPTQWWQDCEICAERVKALNERTQDHAMDQMIDKAIEADAFPNK